MSGTEHGNRYSALVVRQWLTEWDEVSFSAESGQARPQPYFYLLSMPAVTLRALAGIHRRDASDPTPRRDDQSIQRRHDPERSLEIRRFVREGYPFSTLSLAQRRAPDNLRLRKPGWLPTAVVVNVLRPGDKRRAGGSLVREDAVVISGDPDNEELVDFHLPNSWSTRGWNPTGIHPIEVIDGQHRLWAFNQDDENLSFHLPVVAFYDLDVSWQAYLFWTINIKPKRINSSLAFDLYPLLREQDWLLAGEGAMVYRETRAQELTEALWSTEESPWFRRINMLGDTGVRRTQPVTQAAFVRSLITTFVRAWFTPRTTIGGLFGGGAEAGEEGGLGWPRVQQAAFLVAVWRMLDDAIANSDARWAETLREEEGPEDSHVADVDAAFASQSCLLSSDQGVRPVLSVFNDLTYVVARKYDLRSWQIEDVDDDLAPGTVSRALEEVLEHPIADFLRRVCDDLATYDWRNSKAPGLTQEERAAKLVFRGSGGYKELRRQLVEHLRDSDDPEVAETAESVFNRTT